MRRVCFLLRVKPTRLAEYRRRHEEVWPDMLAALRDTGWRNYSLFLRPDGLLVGYFETDDLDSALAFVNSRERPLALYCFSNSRRERGRVLDGAISGGVTLNGTLLHVAQEHLPFGGVKATGNGHREGGFGAIDFYTEWKSIYVDYSDKLQKAQIDKID